MFKLVKIINEFGDNYVGKSGNAIYQKQWGTQVRRMGYKEKKAPSVRQLEVRQRFKDAIEWVKDLDFTDKQALIKFYNNSNYAFDKNYPVNWYNYAKWIFISDIKFSISSKDSNVIIINHPAISSIKVYNSTGVLVQTLSDLTDYTTSTVCTDYSISMPSDGGSILVTTYPGIEKTYGISVPVIPVSEMLYYDSRYYESEYYE